MGAGGDGWMSGAKRQNVRPLHLIIGRRREIHTEHIANPAHR